MYEEEGERSVRQEGDGRHQGRQHREENRGYGMRGRKEKGSGKGGREGHSSEELGAGASGPA